MKLAEYLFSIERALEQAKKSKYGGATTRILTIYKDVIFYLVEKGKLDMSDEADEFKKYLHQFPPNELYLVANYYRQEKGIEKLNYTQEIYLSDKRNRTNTLKSI